MGRREEEFEAPRTRGTSGKVAAGEQGKHGGAPEPEGAGGSGSRPETSRPAAVRPKATASRPEPPGEALPPRLAAGAPLTRPARPTLPMGRGAAERAHWAHQAEAPDGQTRSRRQPLRRVRRARAGAGSGSACARETDAPAPRSSRRPLPAGGPHCAAPPPASSSARRRRRSPSLRGFRLCRVCQEQCSKAAKMSLRANCVLNRRKREHPPYAFVLIHSKPFSYIHRAETKSPLAR